MAPIFLNPVLGMPRDGYGASGGLDLSERKDAHNVRSMLYCSARYHPTRDAWTLGGSALRKRARLGLSGAGSSVSVEIAM